MRQGIRLVRDEPAVSGAGGKAPGAAARPEQYPDFESFYRAYHPVVLGYLRKRMRSAEDAEDLTAKVFLYCYEKWDAYDARKASRSTWLFLVVRSRWIDHLRRSRESVSIDELGDVLADGRDPIGDAVRLEAVRRELTAALENLPENQRRAIILRYFGRYDDREIALRLGTSEGNVRVLLHRGLNRLRPLDALRGLLPD